MIRRLFVCTVVLAWVLLLVAGTVEAQCTGYSITGTSVNILSPTDAAAQGVTTATIYEKGEVGDTSFSHNVTGTPGTRIDWYWKGLNGTSATYTVSGGQSQYDGTFNISLNGSGYEWTLGSADVGLSPYAITFTVTDPNGAKSQDRITMTTVAGSAPGIVSADHIKTNAYYQLVSTFGGG